MDWPVILLLVIGLFVIPVTLLLRNRLSPDAPKDFKSTILPVIYGIAIFWALFGGVFVYFWFT